MNHIELIVAGMTCQHCVASVTGALRASDHVTDVTVDLEHGRAVIATDGLADPDALVDAVTEAGYSAHVVS